MSDSQELVYEVKESNGSQIFLSEKAFEIMYPKVYEAMIEWDATYLEVANFKEGGVKVKSHPFNYALDKNILMEEDVTDSS